MKKIIIIISVFVVACVGIVGGIFLFRKPNAPPPTEARITRISIGGGGAFCSPMIDPTNENIFYTTSDMGAFYYSHNKGETWDRAEARGVFTETHITNNGIIFAGGYGLYTSIDKGKTMNLIYPKNVRYNISRCGWNENLMFAEGYDNGYVKGIVSNNENIFFVTMSWEGKLKIIKIDYNGDNLEVLHTEQTSFLDPVSDVDMDLILVNNGIYMSMGKKVCLFNFENNTLTDVYTTTGYIENICKIEDKIFIIDDLAEKSLILYTTDFVNFSDLLDYNTLTNEFTKFGTTATFNWHFKELVGNNFNNIYLSFSSSANEFAYIVDGIMKFNGTNFEWVFDSMYKTRHVTSLNGWSYGAHGPFYGITENPHNDNLCLFSNAETVFLVEYEKEETKKIKALHCNDYGDERHSTNGLDVQTTYSVKEDPFNKNHIIICTTDLGLQNSYDNGKTWQRMQLPEDEHDIYNTCYDLCFDKYTQNTVYALWSSRHDAPYVPSIYDKDYTKGAFAVSLDGGRNWDFTYSSGLPADSIPVKMSIKQNQNEFIIAVATFNRGFYLSKDGGKTFIAINNGMETVEDLIYGEDIVLTDNIIYCLTAPYLENGGWKPAKLYEFNIENSTINNINLGDITLARSLNYSSEKGLFINVIPTYHYEWYVEYDDGFWVNDNGGIYIYSNGTIEKYFENGDGIFYSTFAQDGKLYATDTYGKVFVIDESGSEVFVEGLFNMLKNISFSLDGKIMYVTTFGGGTYRIII